MQPRSTSSAIRVRKLSSGFTRRAYVPGATLAGADPPNVTVFGILAYIPSGRYSPWNASQARPSAGRGQGQVSTAGQLARAAPRGGLAGVRAQRLPRRLDERDRRRGRILQGRALLELRQ